MKPLHSIFVILNTIIFFGLLVIAARQPVTSQKSKLCGNLACDEVLFKSRVKRVMGINSDPNFLKLTENAVIDVTAVKFSDRFDIMEGKMEDGSRGFFYTGAIDITPYAEFLRTAIDEKKEMQEISQNLADMGDKKLIGVVHSELDLVRDYNAKAAEAAAFNGLPAPTPLPIPQPPNQGGHGHSHGGHGHSHGSHGHSHGEGSAADHGHSHTDQPNAAAQANTIPTPVETPKVEEVAKQPETVPNPAVPEKKENSQEIHLNNVLGQPPVIPEAVPVAPIIPETITVTPATPVETFKMTDMDKEIEALIKRDQELLEKSAQEQVAPGNVLIDENKVEEKTEGVPVAHQNLPESAAKEEVTQPPLILNSLPAEPIAPTPAPVAAEIPITQEVVTPTPIVQDPVAPVVNEQVTTPPTPVADPVVIEPVAQPVDQVPIATTLPPYIPSYDQPEVITTPAPVQVENPVIPEIVPTVPIVEAVASPPAEVADELKKTEPEVPVVPQAGKQDNADEDFKRWEAERKNEAKPYEDAYGDRFKDLGVEKNYSNEQVQSPPSSSGILQMVRSTFGLGDISDSGIVFYINITFVLASILLFGISQMLPSSSGADNFDRNAFFNLTTKHKELEIQLKAKIAEIQNLQIAGQQHQQAAVNDQEVIALRNEVHQLQNELHNTQVQRSELESHLSQWSESCNEKQSEIERLIRVVAEYEQRLEVASHGGQEAARELDGLRSTLNESQKEVLSRNEKIMELTKKIDELQSNLHTAHSESARWKEEFDDAERCLQSIEIELKQAKIENANLVDVVQQYEKNQEQGSAAGSGGSGWSDFGESDEIELEKKTARQDEKTPEASQSGGADSNDLSDIRAKYQKYGEDMEQIRLLKEKIVELEKDLAEYKSLYEKEEKKNAEKDSKIKALERDVTDARKKAEDLESEKTKTSENINDMFKTLSSSMNKTSEMDKLVSSLREEGFAKDKQLFEADVAGRKKDDKIREIETDLKRLQREYTKLETKSFHDVMQLKKKLDDIQTSQLLGNSAMPLASRDMFTSDLGPVDMANRRTAMGSPLDDPIWDEPEFGASRQTGPEDYFSSGSMTMPGRRRSTRRTGLIMANGENSPSDREEKSKSKKEVSHRRRSRSHGRQPQMYSDFAPQMQYIPPSSDSSFMSHSGPGFPPLSGRHSKSGNLHYSSGGSNGGRSPPPEMPLLSAIPPPGVRKTPSKRMDAIHHHHGK